MIAAIVLAILVVGIFAVGPVSAGYADLSKVADKDEYVIGETITYTLTVTNDDPKYIHYLDVYDRFNGDTEYLVASITLSKGGGTWSGTESFTIAASNVDNGWVKNYLRVEGIDSQGKGVNASIEEWSPINITINFTYAATDCMEVTVTPSHSGPVAWHQWIIDSVPGSVVNTAPVPMTLTSCGSKSVTLKGGVDPGNLANYVAFTDTVYVACEPIVEAERTPTGCVEIGDSVTFSASITTPGTLPYSYLWTFTNGLASSNDPTVTRTIPAGGTTATLTVTDNLDCEDDDSVSVSICSTPPQKPPSDVPILTPTGMVALIGMLCIVGAGRILTKGRRS